MPDREGNFLSLDAGSEYLQLCLSMPGKRRERIRHIRVLDAGLRHVEGLLPEIENLIAHGGLAPADLHGLITGRGPGSFTGLRIAMAAMKGLSSALEIPLVSISALEAIAWKYHRSEAIVAASIDARKSRYYCGVWNFAGAQEISGDGERNYREMQDFLEAHRIVKPSDLLPGELGMQLHELQNAVRIGGDTGNAEYEQGGGTPVLLAGPHSGPLAGDLKQAQKEKSIPRFLHGSLQVLPFNEWVSSMDELGRSALALGISDPETFGPEYLRSSEAEIHS